MLIELDIQRPQPIASEPEPARQTPFREGGTSFPITRGIYWVRIIQRLGDVFASALLLALLSPLFLILGVCLKLDSPGPVLFKQKRVGKNGKLFFVYKFRSMVADAETRRQALEAYNERNGPVFKMRDDPRITRMGKVLRRCSLDELPQLLNVLTGEMSLIGPRPALPNEVARYTDHQRQRLAVVPGMTGLWQVSGRSKLSFERSMDLDLIYIEHQSIALNLRILFMTVPAVLTGEGAW